MKVKVKDKKKIQITLSKKQAKKLAALLNIPPLSTIDPFFETLWDLIDDIVDPGMDSEYDKLSSGYEEEIVNNFRSVGYAFPEIEELLY